MCARFPTPAVCASRYWVGTAESERRQLTMVADAWQNNPTTLSMDLDVAGTALNTSLSSETGIPLSPETILGGVDAGQAVAAMLTLQLLPGVELRDWEEKYYIPLCLGHQSDHYNLRCAPYSGVFLEVCTKPVMFQPITEHQLLVTTRCQRGLFHHGGYLNLLERC